MSIFELPKPIRVVIFVLKTAGPNMVVNMCKEVQYLNEIKDLVVAAFRWMSKEHTFSNENM